MGGSASAELDRETLAEASWLVQHGELGSPWGRFVIQRYGSGIAATGMNSSAAVPRLLRKRVQDWDVQGCTVHLGPDFVSFGRQLSSPSYSETDFFYGIDILFGQHPQSSWLWYCHPQVWLLRLHKAILEELPSLPEPTAVAVSSSAGTSPSRTLIDIQRFPGRPRWLGDSPPPSAQADIATAVGSCCPNPSGALCGEPIKSADVIPGELSGEPSNEAPGKCLGEGSRTVEPSDGNRGGAIEESSVDAMGTAATHEAPEDVSGDVVRHQLLLFFGNSEGHPGLLRLPVPASRMAETEVLVTRWEQWQVPLQWSGQRWESVDDFRRLLDEALVMSDLLLLGLDLELAEALTPDWTWEVYARGFGEVAFAETTGQEVTRIATSSDSEPAANQLAHSEEVAPVFNERSLVLP